VPAPVRVGLAGPRFQFPLHPLELGRRAVEAPGVADERDQDHDGDPDGPELALGAGCLCRHGSNQGVRMRLHKRKIPEDEADIASQFFLHVLDCVVRLAAVRALEVRVLHQRHTGIRTALHEIVVMNGGRQLLSSVTSHEVSFLYRQYGQRETQEPCHLPVTISVGVSLHQMERISNAVPIRLLIMTAIWILIKLTPRAINAAGEIAGWRANYVEHHLEVVLLKPS